MTFLVHAAEVILVIAFYAGLAYLVRDFFFSPPIKRRAEDGYAVMAPEQREFPIRSTREARAAVTAGPRDHHRR